MSSSFDISYNGSKGVSFNQSEHGSIILTETPTNRLQTLTMWCRKTIKYLLINSTCDIGAWVQSNFLGTWYRLLFFTCFVIHLILYLYYYHYRNVTYLIFWLLLHVFDNHYCCYSYYTNHEAYKGKWPPKITMYSSYFIHVFICKNKKMYTSSKLKTYRASNLWIKHKKVNMSL